MFNQIYYLQLEIEKGNWNTYIDREYEEIRTIRCKGIEYLDKRYWKLKMGEVPWSKNL